MPSSADCLSLAPVLIGARSPAAADHDRLRVGVERWQAAVAALDAAPLSAAADLLQADPAAGRLFAGVFGNSPFLSLIAEREPAFFLQLLRCGPDAAVPTILEAVAVARQRGLDGVDPAPELRRCKRRIALAVGIADIAGIWSVEQVTEALSVFAEAALDAALSFLLIEAAGRGAIVLADATEPLRACGLVILGMGKLGAGELNYSSDIDLVVFYDPHRFQTPNADNRQREAARLTRGLVREMAERTTDGYVFRTDLRLRPDPGATPVAISIVAAEEYYETLGQNWERAAMIKARPVGGDRTAGEDFVQKLRPFIWRKHLDFAAIQDIHSIKRQINAHRGGARIAIYGHNVKLGRGGIREIEFFAQTQQLIWGGRLPAVRVRGTVAALTALARAGKISVAVADDLTRAYRFLRRVEHRLQMIDDSQTHTLPVDAERFAALATFLGYGDADKFKAELLATLRCVEGHYAELFEDAPALALAGDIGGNLVFTGADADPETLVTLEGLGFADSKVVDSAVRAWHHGRCRAMRSTRARELLTELTPHLLKALAEKPDPDAAFRAFDRFLTGLPAGIQLFSMFHANPPLLGLVTDILGVAPALADYLARWPGVLESVLSAPDFFASPPPLDALLDELAHLLEQGLCAEERLDISRRWANDRRFQIGVQSLKGMIDTPAAMAAWSSVAEVSLRGLLPHVEADFARAHGRIAGCDIAVVGMGKLGGREMTTTSDLDLILIYSTSEVVAVSSGEQPLAASQYFARLSQRLISAISAPTAAGRLYEVDMRLRPSGKAGPIAVSATTFARYQQEEAWVWEQMALTRARVVAGPSVLANEIEAVIRAVLTRPRDATLLVVEVADMRARMAEEHRPQSNWDVKHLRGGLVDIEFIAQYLQLLHAWRVPEILSTNTHDALMRLRTAGLLDEPDAVDLLDALSLWQAVQSRVRLNIGEQIRAVRTEAPRALRLAVEGIAGLDFDRLVERMETSARRVHDVFRRLIDAPAEQARARIAAREADQHGSRPSVAAIATPSPLPPAHPPLLPARTRRPVIPVAKRTHEGGSMSVDVGDLVPDFALPTDDGGIVTAAGLRGRICVLYFYPRDDTPGCTTEAKAFRDAIFAFAAVEVTVIGISADGIDSHRKFKNKHELTFTLASDSEKALAQALGVWVEKSMYGRKYVGMERATFLIDGAGVIRMIWHKVKVKGHVDAVLQAARALAGEDAPPA